MIYKNLTAPDDYASRKAAIARQEKLAEMLSQMGAQEQAVSTAGGITAPVSGMGALARGLTSFGGAYLSGSAAADAAALKKAGLAEAKDARKSFYTLDDTTMPGGEATLFAPTPGGSNMPSAPPPGNMPLPNYIAQDAGAMAAGPAAAQPGDLRPFDIRPTEQKATFGDITTKGLPRSREDQSRLLDEYEMSDNPYLQNLSQRLRAESKGQMFEGNKAGVYRLNANDEVETVVPASTEADDLSPFSKLLNEKDRLIAGGAKKDDPRVKALDAKINLETTRAPGVTVSMGDKTDRVLSDLYGDDLKALRTKKDSAQNILSIIGDIRAIPVGKLYSGPTADLKTTAASYLEAIGLGGIDNDKIANSQEYQAKIADLGISKIKGALGVNPTDRDLEYVKMTLPLLTKVPAARARLLDLLEKRANTDIGNYKSATAYYRKNNNLEEWSPLGSRTSTNIPTSGF